MKQVSFIDLCTHSALIMFVVPFYQLDNEEFTKIVDGIREKYHGGPYCREVSQVPVGGVLGLQPDDDLEVV